jgi:antitoxin ParD1/3/4
MPTRNVVLTERQAELVEKLVESGRYQNGSEVLREGLRLLEQREAEDRAKLKALRAAAKIGSDDIAAGRYRDFDSEASLRAHLTGLAEEAIGRQRK